jgi:hypothetical protein
VFGFARVAQINRPKFDAHWGRKGLKDGPLSDPNWAILRITDDTHARDMRRDLLEQLKPFDTQAILELGEAG